MTELSDIARKRRAGFAAASDGQRRRAVPVPGSGHAAGHATRLADDRDRFMQGEEPSGVRDAILASWRRSVHFGVTTDHLKPRYEADIDTDGHLRRAARPVLDRLENVLSGSPMTVVLTDPHAYVLERRAGERGLNRHLDDIMLAPGFSYAEQFVGTNGIGTTLEERRAAHVFGPEHFSGLLQSVSCAGAPIRNQLTGRLAGVIDLTCWKVDVNPLMLALVREAAAEIEDRLLEQSTTAERALLREFLAACRQADRAVVGVNQELVMANPAASRLLNADDHLMLRRRASDLAGTGRRTVVTVDLSAGRRATLRIRPVKTGSGLAGAVVEIDPNPEHARRGPQPQPAVRGRRRQTLTAWETLERDAVVTALREAGGDKARAAVALGISRATIYRKIHAYDIVIDRPGGRGESDSGAVV